MSTTPPIVQPDIGGGSQRHEAPRDQRMAQKLGEEAVELALAAVSGDRAEQLDEAADLVYHLLVLLNARGLNLADVSAVLERRHARNSKG